MQHSKTDASNNHTRLRSHRWPTGFVFCYFDESVTDQRTDGPTNRWTDPLIEMRGRV